MHELKVVCSRDPDQTDSVTLHFPRELPILTPYWRRSRFGRISPRSLSRSSSITDFARHLTFVNRGRLSIELPSPSETYLQLVEELAVVDGLVRVSTGERYSLTIEVGRCFSAQTVCEAVANCLLRHLYPGHTALVQLEDDHDTRCTVSRCPLYSKGNMPHQYR